MWCLLSCQQKKLMLEEKVFHFNKKSWCWRKKYFMSTKKVDVGRKGYFISTKKRLMLEEKVFHVNKKSWCWRKKYFMSTKKVDVGQKRYFISTKTGWSCTRKYFSKKLLIFFRTMRYIKLCEKKVIDLKCRNFDERNKVSHSKNWRHLIIDFIIKIQPVKDLLLFYNSQHNTKLKKNLLLIFLVFFCTNFKKKMSCKKG